MAMDTTEEFIKAEVLKAVDTVMEEVIKEGVMRREGAIRVEAIKVEDTGMEEVIKEFIKEVIKAVGTATEGVIKAEVIKEVITEVGIEVEEVTKGEVTKAEVIKAVGTGTEEVTKAEAVREADMEVIKVAMMIMEVDTMISTKMITEEDMAMITRVEDTTMITEETMGT